MNQVSIIILSITEAAVSFLLIGIILIQHSKGQGVGLSFGGSAGEAIFGAQMGNVLTRATVILGILFLVNTTLLSVLGTRAGGSSDSVVDDGAMPMPAAMPSDIPTGGMDPMTAPGR